MSEKKCIFISLGFDTSSVMKAFAEYNLHSGDKFIFVTPHAKHPRKKASKEDIRNLIEALLSRGVKLDYIFLTVNEESPKDMILQIIKVILNHSDCHIYLEASGGIRAICVAMYIAGNVFSDRVKRCSAVLETTGKKINFPFITLPASLPSALETDLQEVRSTEGEVSLADLAIKMEKDRSTLSRQLNELEDYGLIERKSKKPATYALTLAGKLWFLKRGV